MTGPVIASWGGLIARPEELIVLTDRDQIAPRLQTKRVGLAYGMGRSYGDVGLNSGGAMWSTAGLDRLIQFDPASGQLQVEAGVLLRDIQRLFLARGWSLAVSPGTQMVTVGGAIANDVHGKNHHRAGSFGDHVKRLRLVRTTGEVIDCGPDLRPDWFAATVGGLGLTGVIATATLQLAPSPGPWLDVETIAYGSLAEFFRLAEQSEQTWEHTVSWIDCLARPAGRGLFMRGNAAAYAQRRERPKRQLSMPVQPPFPLVNRFSLQGFNRAYFLLNQRRSGRSIAHYQSFFYPLDHIAHWNRMYGPKGFFQYQSVVPLKAANSATHDMLAVIGRSGQGSFLSVLKTFGARRSVGMLGFARPGVTLALDFPHRGPSTLRLLTELDAIVRQHGGAIYPAKDARMPRDLFESGYPQLNTFLTYRDPGISSELSRRLLGS